MMATDPQCADVVLDFFAGSGTTADAVIQQNGEDGGNRRYIAVQLGEPTGHDDYARVSDITLTRINAAIEDVEGAETQGLRVFRLADSSFCESAADEGLLDLTESTLKQHAEPDAIAAEVLLAEGVSLDSPWERHSAGGAPVVIADGVAVVLGTKISRNVTDAVFSLRPKVAVFLEDGFADADAVKASAYADARAARVIMKTV